MKKFNISFLIIGIFLASCVQTKKYNEVILKPGTMYYSLSHKMGDPSKEKSDTILFEVKTAIKGNRASVTQKNNKLSIVPTKGKPNVSSVKILQSKISPKTFNALIAKEVKNTFPSPALKVKPSAKSDVSSLDDYSMILKEKKNNDIESVEPFRYMESDYVFQAMTVPFKYRKQINDTIAAQTTSSFNVGFAIGKKIKWNSFTQYYRGNSLLKARAKSISLTPGVFVGPTLISLKNGSNVNAPIDLDRTVAGITTGMFIVVGVNKFNLGLAYGIDQALGSDRSKWIFQDNPGWWGFVIGFDFIK